MRNITINYAKLLMTATFAILLVACKSTPMPIKGGVSDSVRNGINVDGTGAVVEGAVVDAMNMDGNVNELNDPHNILSKRNIYFDYNSDTIRDEFLQNIEAHANYLQMHSDAKVSLQGNADERGTREYNLSLGQRRSVAVKNALNILGISDGQIETVSYGEENANTNCSDEHCYQQDRRVEIVYTRE